jgi:hypothetical protein
MDRVRLLKALARQIVRFCTAGQRRVARTCPNPFRPCIRQSELPGAGPEVPPGPS